MTEHPIDEFMKGRTQKEVAYALGMTQGAISQLVRSGRNVVIVTDKRGHVTSAYEKRAVGSFSTNSALPAPAA